MGRASPTLHGALPMISNLDERTPMNTEERVNRLEAQRETHLTECGEYRGEIWKAISALRVEFAKQSTKVAFIVGGLGVAAQVVIAFLIKRG